MNIVENMMDKCTMVFYKKTWYVNEDNINFVLAYICSNIINT